jgi:hypothetical protein
MLAPVLSELAQAQRYQVPMERGPFAQYCWTNRVVGEKIASVSN